LENPSVRHDAEDGEEFLECHWPLAVSVTELDVAVSMGQLKLSSYLNVAVGVSERTKRWI
jgi:hypothetical protein